MSEQTYDEFLAAKRKSDKPSGFNPKKLSDALFDFQADIVRWALRRGRAAIFADCGLGKTLMQLEWAHRVCEKTGGNVLILAPLAVSAQTKREGERFGIPVTIARTQQDVQPGITITNYEMLEHFDAASFEGVVLDESSILKNFNGATRTQIIESFARTPYRLACTATPAPNDFMELGNHAEFLGTMTRTEMLSMYFVHDGGETQAWRLKGHAQKDFWEWVCSWSVMLRKPSDLGYDDRRFMLPPLVYREHLVEADPIAAGVLFDCDPASLEDRRKARRASIDGRVAQAAALVNESDQELQWLIWCDLNEESEKVTASIPGAVEVTGSDTNEHKEASMVAFAEGRIRVMVSKVRIAGLGMNFQSCSRMAFVGLSDSYEALYQAVRRCWRFGQKDQVEAHIITATTEGATLSNIKRKERDAEEMAKRMVENMGEINRADLHGTRRSVAKYKENVARGDGWELRLGDCVEEVRKIASDSVGFSVFSPPFASLYTYSNSERDMGNCLDTEEFFAHFRFLIAELFRVTIPGREVSFHCMNLPTSKVRDGVIGLRDFRGELIAAFQAAGWIYHAEVCIWKDPVTAMQRTKALGLLHKQLKKDSCMSRHGIPDYLVTMRKPGENPNPVSHTNESFPVSEWQKIASPIWMDIDPGDTLQYASAREHEDERHICPLQLEVIRRALRLWTRPGDLVLSPFAGIGSEGHEAVRLGRRFVGVELKESYWKQAALNLQRASTEAKSEDLFGRLDGADAAAEVTAEDAA